MDELSYRSASECMALLRSRQVSSVNLVDACIARIEALNPELNAVVAKDYERARDKARASDAARAQGKDLGVLHGLPMTIKDSLETAGLVTTSGAPELRDHMPRQSAVAVQRVVDAGAIILGKTNLPIYAGRRCRISCSRVHPIGDRKRHRGVHPNSSQLLRSLRTQAHARHRSRARPHPRATWDEERTRPCGGWAARPNRWGLDAGARCHCGPRRA